jgi:small subunit ribosomal protein S20
MANYKSAIKRIRSSAVRRIRNRYQAKTCRNAIRNLRSTTNKAEAEKLFPQVIAMIDKLAKKNVIHKNKAANNKSSLARYVNSLK